MIRGKLFKQKTKIENDVRYKSGHLFNHLESLGAL